MSGDKNVSMKNWYALLIVKKQRVSHRQLQHRSNGQLSKYYRQEVNERQSLWLNM
jgi:hypothetical protein